MCLYVLQQGVGKLPAIRILLKTFDLINGIASSSIVCCFFLSVKPAMLIFLHSLDIEVLSKNITISPSHKTFRYFGTVSTKPLNACFHPAHDYG